jgi:hypothetical protein
MYNWFLFENKHLTQNVYSVLCVCPCPLLLTANYCCYKISQEHQLVFS